MSIHHLGGEALLSAPPPAGRTLTLPPGAMVSILPPPSGARTSPKTPEAEIGPFAARGAAALRANRSGSEVGSQRSSQGSPITANGSGPNGKHSESPLHTMMRNNSTNQFERMAMSLTMDAEASLEMSAGAVDPPLGFLPSTVNTPKASSTSTMGSLELTLYETVSNGASINLFQLPRSLDESPPPSITTTEAGSFSERRSAAQQPQHNPPWQQP